MNWEITGGTVAILALLWGVYTSHRGWSENTRNRRAEYIRNYYQSDTLPCLFLEIDAHRFEFRPDLDRHAGGSRLRSSAPLPQRPGHGRSAEHHRPRGIAQDHHRIRCVGLVAEPGVEWFLARVDAQDTAESTGTEAFGYFRRLGQALEATA